MDRLVKAAIFVCIPFSCNCAIAAPSDHFDDFEFEEIDVVIEVNGHVHTTMAAASSTVILSPSPAK